jgi:hypothetical protein
VNKAELRELAEWGVRRKVEAIERQLAVLYAEFPNVFIGDKPPMLVRAEERESGNGWNGNMQNALVRSSAAKSSWTPERRAKASRAMKARIKKYGGSLRNAEGESDAKPTKAKKTKGKSKNTGKKRGLKRLWHDRLMAMGGSEQIGESAKALQTSSASLITSGKSFLDAKIIKKTGPGLYAINGPMPPEE